MELTVYAAWLNDVFALFDSFLLGLHHELALAYSEYLNPIANALGAGGHFGIMFIALAVILLIFRKTRMAGVAILVSIAIAGAFSEFVIKDLVDRPRPFLMSDTYNAWWQFVGSPDAHSSSFPSGHVAAATAAAISLAYAARRWWVSLLGVLLVIAMAMDRMYLMVHYPSDVLAGFILGFISGIIGYAIVQGIWRLMGKHPDQLLDEKVAASGHARDIPIPRGSQGNYQYQMVPMTQGQGGYPAPMPQPQQQQPMPPANSASYQPTQRMNTMQQAQGQSRRPSNYAGPVQGQNDASKTQRMPQRIEDLRR